MIKKKKTIIYVFILQRYNVGKLFIHFLSLLDMFFLYYFALIFIPLLMAGRQDFLDSGRKRFGGLV